MTCAAVIREVAAGRRYVDPEIAADALSDERSPLTDRELDVLRAGARGETVAEIAAALHLSAGNGAQPRLVGARKARARESSAGDDPRARAGVDLRSPGSAERSIDLGTGGGRGEANGHLVRRSVEPIAENDAVAIHASPVGGDEHVRRS